MATHYPERTNVLSPDFMAALEDRAADRVDVEIAGKDLFLVDDAQFYSDRNLTALFGMADEVLSSLERLSKTWLASSKAEEAAIAQGAQATRHHLIFQRDLVGAVVSLLALAICVSVMISAITTPEPPLPNRGTGRSITTSITP